jgi:hypothetical protein
VRLALYRSELEGLLERQKAVRTTLERDEAEGRATLAGTGLSKSHRLAVEELEEQVARDEAARSALDAELAASQAAEAELETRAEALQKDYQAMIDVMLGELARKRTPPEPAAAAAGTAATKQP